MVGYRRCMYTGVSFYTAFLFISYSFVNVSMSEIFWKQKSYLHASVKCLTVHSCKVYKPRRAFPRSCMSMVIYIIRSPVCICSFLPTFWKWFNRGSATAEQCYIQCLYALQNQVVLPTNYFHACSQNVGKSVPVEHPKWPNIVECCKSNHSRNCDCNRDRWRASSGPTTFTQNI